MGVTYANFQSLGIELSLKDVLKSSVKGFTIFSMVSSNILGWILSGPGVLFGFRFLNAFRTCSSLISTVLMFGGSGVTVNSGSSVSGSIVNTLAKYSLSRSAVSLSEDVKSGPSPFSNLLPYKRNFSRVSNFAILWSKVVSLFSRVQFRRGSRNFRQGGSNFPKI